MANDQPSVQIVPYLFYADASAAIDFLCKAFGFVEQFRYPMPDGKVGHAELDYEGNSLMLASVWPEGGMSNPLDLAAVHSMVYCNVKNVDAHYEHASAAGATIVSEPNDQHGQRQYRAMDPEGHRWLFAGPLPKQGR